MKASFTVKKSFTRENEYVTCFYVDGFKDTDERGTEGTGCKLYPTKEKAIAAGKRYLKKMQKNGFEI